MRFSILLGLAAGLTLTQAGPSGAAALTFTGTLANDASVATDIFSVAAGNYVIDTKSYAGGTLADGTVLSAGGFDPVLTLFAGSGIAGSPIAFNDDGGPNVAFDPATFQNFDSYLAVTLSGGTYTLAITQSDNYWNAASQAWTQTNPGFTAANLCDAGQFCDATGASRTNAYGGEILPEPAGALTFAAGLAAWARIRRIKRR